MAELPDHFGAEVAARYDEDVDAGNPASVEPVVDVLAELAGDGGRALELAIGTGRIALPLARRGVEVHGIDWSQAMLDQLAAKPGGADIPVVRGDMASATVPGGPFDLVYLVFNTIMNLTSQDAQVRCFENAAAHLAPGGHFVVEVLVPALQLVPFGQSTYTFALTDTYHGVDVYDVATQSVTSHHFYVRDDGPAQVSTPCRYVWPSELDLMARIAGLTHTARWAGWAKDPFTATSRMHVSVWSRPARTHEHSQLTTRDSPLK